ncbi:F1F0 ATP synthase subunit k KNAG_0K00920 [Huiozyma naganishii CBS 8797]|uniref:ATP synthase subunit K, mitochondrial n=1 Tax=Huiozyma naganishii (strain ATCC MYA-139 / BCRC 22969 / CBS 8797 / KCTC 17520 / NBRC 10181 / NCYC 3082 / Yp74L-3) TaxID=1071383 RepID=J7S374_HUIN7|nr:hypothetical protein KNAG_0K00920 [Kazachstania naganishii CBS 8797]CCK72457.1 hypothetical protein KNAG_0K00920 [Kazachstania naganishii CBS 8797]
MGSTYEILGRTFKPHQLALGTLGFLSLIVMPNPFAAKKEKVVDIKAGSKEEEQFIKAYLEKHTT